MYLQSKGSIFESETGDLFDFIINTGVKQGDGTSPELFTLFFDRIYPYLVDYYNTNTIDGTKRHAFTIASL